MILNIRNLINSVIDIEYNLFSSQVMFRVVVICPPFGISKFDRNGSTSDGD